MPFRERSQASPARFTEQQIILHERSGFESKYKWPRVTAYMFLNKEQLPRLFFFPTALTADLFIYLFFDPIHSSLHPELQPMRNQVYYSQIRLEATK